MLSRSRCASRWQIAVVYTMMCDAINVLIENDEMNMFIGFVSTDALEFESGDEIAVATTTL